MARFISDDPAGKTEVVLWHVMEVSNLITDQGLTPPFLDGYRPFPLVDLNCLFLVFWAKLPLDPPIGVRLWLELKRQVYRLGRLPLRGTYQKRL